MIQVHAETTNRNSGVRQKKKREGREGKRRNELTLRMASTILALPAWTATVDMVVVEGCSDESSESSDDASSEVVRFCWSIFVCVFSFVGGRLSLTVLLPLSSDAIQVT